MADPPRRPGGGSMMTKSNLQSILFSVVVREHSLDGLLFLSLKKVPQKMGILKD